MARFRWAVFCLPLFYFFVVSASPVRMSGEDLLQYIEKKLRRNSVTLRINNKNLGDEGAKTLAQSPLLKSVKTLVIYKGNIGDAGVRALADSTSLESRSICTATRSGMRAPWPSRNLTF